MPPRRFPIRALFVWHLSRPYAANPNRRSQIYWLGASGTRGGLAGALADDQAPEAAYLLLFAIAIPCAISLSPPATRRNRIIEENGCPNSRSLDTRLTYERAVPRSAAPELS